MKSGDDKRTRRLPETERLDAVDDGDRRDTESAGGATERIDPSGAAGPTRRLGDDGGTDADRALLSTEPAPAPTSRSGGDDSDAHDRLAVGTVLRGRFRITGVLGSGGMGTVYRACDLLKEEARDQQTDVALKVLKPDIANAELSFMALQREARRAQQLAHPNIVTVYDFDRADGVIFMTMEFMAGRSLESLLDEHPEGLEPEQARTVARHLIEGLAYAHKRGIVHSDLKPENVFVLEEGRAKILDFGIARAYQPAQADFVEEAIRGFTPPYATPELLAGNKPTPADDVYALACVLYEAYTGRHPFDFASGKDAKWAGLKPARSTRFDRAEWKAIAAALDFDPARRPADATQFRRMFLPSPVRRTALIVSTLAVAAAVAYTLLYEPEPMPDVPFESLSETVQAQVVSNLADARLFAEQGDLNSALQLYDAVLRAHPGNRDAVGGMNATAARVVDRIEQAHAGGELPADSARAALEALLSYDTLPGRSRDLARQALARL